MLKVGDKVGLWHKDTCRCGKDYYVSRTFEKIVTEKDLYCSDCNDAFELDLAKRELKECKTMLKMMVDVSEELNYRLAKTEQPQGFHHHIEVVKNFIKEE
ncbi:hypothetical protein vBVpaMR16F_158 [Vibrio phage vB_VpaM_R16F]|nr:hypothetical protein vBVpaMR16F_158 [Vibrio phage vB_VpaM_R16F]